MLEFERFICITLMFCVNAAFGPPLVATPEIQGQTVRRVIHIAAPATHESRYAYVPFEVPAGAVRITVSYQYDRVNGNNTLDIGLFDARSTDSETDTAGFRGWSGGRRTEFFISRADATPGYLPGELPPGTWRIILGLYRVAPAGVDVSFSIKIETDANQSADEVSVQGKSPQSSPLAKSSNTRQSLLQQEPAPSRSRWWSGDLHMHTLHSDGDWTVGELISSARKAGLDFICITDHNTSSHHTEIDRAPTNSPPLVLRGEEVTTYGGHTNVCGLPSGAWVDFRSRPADSSRMSAIAAQAHRSGALISINHPFGPCTGCSWSYDAAVSDFDAIEIWNGAWDQTDEQALMMWDKLLQTGRKIVAIAASDSHRATNPIGQPSTNVQAPMLSQTALLEAIRAGNVYLTSEVGKPVVSFEAEIANKPRSRATIGHEIHLNTPKLIRFSIDVKGAPPDAMISLISNGQVLRQFSDKIDGSFEIQCQQDSYLRLEIRDKTKRMLALTNPIYVKIKHRR